MEQFITIVQAAVKARGKILVPTFAVGRAQLLMTLLSQMFRRKLVSPFPIFLDSPMAIAATEIYEHHHELFDEEMLKYIAQNPVREDLSTLKVCPTAEDSKKINDQLGPCLVMAGAALLTYTTASSWGLLALTAVATLVFLRTRLHPLIVLGIATALGASGWLS